MILQLATSINSITFLDLWNRALSIITTIPGLRAGARQAQCKFHKCLQLNILRIKILELLRQKNPEHEMILRLPLIIAANVASQSP